MVGTAAVASVAAAVGGVGYFLYQSKQPESKRYCLLHYTMHLLHLFLIVHSLSISFSDAEKCPPMTHVSARMVRQRKVLQAFHHHAVIMGTGGHFLSQIRSWQQTHTSIAKEDYQHAMNFLLEHQTEVVVVENDGEGPQVATVRHFFDTHADHRVVLHKKEEVQSIQRAISLAVRGFMIRRAAGEHKKTDDGKLIIVCEGKCVTDATKVPKLQAQRGWLYDLFDHNCEHFANSIMTGRLDSQQIDGIRKVFPQFVLDQVGTSAHFGRAKFSHYHSLAVCSALYQDKPDEKPNPSH